MTSFADSWEHQELLKISKQHLGALDRSRIRPDAIIGVDNASNLKVSTVFAAIAIEAALNDYVLSHCLSLERPYLQDVFGEIAKRFLRGSVQDKIQLLCRNWPDEFPPALLSDIRKLFAIRNRISHRTGEFPARNESGDGNAVMKNSALSNDDMQHMLRHYDIASDFLSRFWLPGSRELQQPGRQ